MRQSMLVPCRKTFLKKILNSEEMPVKECILVTDNNADDITY